MKFGLSDGTIEKINCVFARHPEIDEVLIYGSRAKGTYREGSDIDITLKGTNLTENLRAEVFSEIDDLNTPYLFDISVFDRLQSEPLIGHINRVGQVLYEKRK
jgi:predicted nucleotidyltransferase